MYLLCSCYLSINFHFKFTLWWLGRVKELKIKWVQDFPVFRFVELQDNKLLKLKKIIKKFPFGYGMKYFNEIEIHVHICRLMIILECFTDLIFTITPLAILWKPTFTGCVFLQQFKISLCIGQSKNTEQGMVGMVNCSSMNDLKYSTPIHSN